MGIGSGVVMAVATIGDVTTTGAFVSRLTVESVGSGVIGETVSSDVGGEFGNGIGAVVGSGAIVAIGAGPGDTLSPVIANEETREGGREGGKKRRNEAGR